MKKWIIFLVALVPNIASATSAIQGLRRCNDLKILLDNNDLSTSRTFNVEKLDGYDHLKFDVKYTHAASGDITFTCTYLSATPADIPPNLFAEYDTRMTTCVTSAGTCTLQLAGEYVLSVTGDVNYGIDLGILNVEEVDCTVDHSAGTASDFITVVGRKCVR